MSNEYWNQWDYSEIMSMQGIELQEVDIDFCQDIEEKEEHCCSGCMDCLGLSWRDFM